MKVDVAELEDASVTVIVCEPVEALEGTEMVRLKVMRPTNWW